LRQRIESRLAELYFEKKNYSDALHLITSLIREVRRLDDKVLLVEIHLLESRVHHALRDPSKARAALTASRTAANAIYIVPLLQAEIDLQSGILHAEEKDYSTAYSYFYEAFEGFHNLDHPMATTCLKYLLLVKIMTNNPEEVQSLLSSKNALKYSGRDVEAMRAVTNAYQDRSLHAFDDAKQTYKVELLDDPVINAHLSELYDNLLEQHLLRVIEPFSRVQISHVAVLVGLSKDRIERKLSQMILDKKLNGTLDQGRDCLIVFEEVKQDKAYPSALKTIENMNDVLDSLFERSKQLTK
jgi:26S proteasome regulatory subunit N6